MPIASPTPTSSTSSAGGARAQACDQLEPHEARDGAPQRGRDRCFLAAPTIQASTSASSGIAAPRISAQSCASARQGARA